MINNIKLNSKGEYFSPLIVKSNKNAFGFFNGIWKNNNQINISNTVKKQ